MKTVDEGMEILTGMKPGQVDEPGTVHFAVHKALESYALKMKKFNE